MRLQTDLVGSIGTMQRITVRHRNDIQAVQEVWSDARSKHFIETELPDLEEAVKRLVVYLQKTIDFASEIHQRTHDDRPEE